MSVYSQESRLGEVVHVDLDSDKIIPRINVHSPDEPSMIHNPQTSIIIVAAVA